MNAVLRHVLLTVICLGSVGTLGWLVVGGFQNRASAVLDDCDGSAVGTIRINENGNPQICLKR